MLKDFQKIIYKIFKIYWKIFKPKTFGVKVLIKVNNQFLFIKNTYTCDDKYNIPGGGYNPKKEKAESAAKREVEEELGLILIKEKLSYIGNYYSESEGKRDNVDIFLYDMKRDFKIKSNYEISSYTLLDSGEINQNNSYRMVLYSLDLYKKYLNN